MCKFKVGDTVKFIEDYGKFKMGEIAKVTYIMMASGGSPGEYFLLNVENSENINTCFEKRVELVKENEMSELEELVKKANEGYKAAYSLLKYYKDKFEYKNSHTNEEWIDCNWMNGEGTTQLRVKSKPKFEPFYVNNGEWKVWKDRDYTLVGCKRFNSKDLANSLSEFIRDNINVRYEFSATKSGVKYEEYILSWEDAEKILTELEKCDA